MQKKSIHFPQLYVYICYLMFFYPMSNNFEESYGLFFLDKYFWVMHFMKGLYRYVTIISWCR